MQVINNLVIDRFKTDDRPSLTLVPQGNLQEFWLPLTVFDLSINAKNGCHSSALYWACIKCIDLTAALVLKNFVWLAFAKSTRKMSKLVHILENFFKDTAALLKLSSANFHTVIPHALWRSFALVLLTASTKSSSWWEFWRPFTKWKLSSNEFFVSILHVFTNMNHYNALNSNIKEWDEDKLNDAEVVHMLKSFRWIRCAYTHFQNPSQHHLLSLRASAAPSQTDCCRSTGLEH